MLSLHRGIFRQALKIWHNNYANHQYMSMKSSLPQNVIVFQDDELIICWHPEPQFPYECTKPIPTTNTRKEDSNVTALQIGTKEISEVFKFKRSEVVVEELSKLTYTTKHRWYPRSRDKFAKKTQPDRPYL